MAFDFTPGLQRALTRALSWAQGGDAILPGHLFQGLIEESEGTPFLLLVEAGLTPEALTSLLTPPPPPTNYSLPLAALTRTVLNQAQSLTRSVSTETTIPSDLVLLALLRQEDGLRARLEEMGLDFGRLKEKIQPTPPVIRLEVPLDLLETTDQMDLGRVLDAAGNRAREALRVLEDYCRFLLNDPLLTGQLKDIRHELSQALATLPENLLLTARDTLHDVGTQLTTDQEHHRGSSRDVVQANAKRLQEAMRTLEEFGKVFHPTLGQSIEQLRYRTYTVERSLVFADQARERLGRARLYVLVTESLCRLSLFGTVAEILAGGAQVVQLREKNVDDRGLLEKAREVRKMVHDAGAIFIVNDRPDIARLADADGVHLGQDDMPMQEARRIIGPRGLIGISTHNLAQVRQALDEGASYLGVGPTFPSQTKTFAEFPGLDFVSQATATTSLPAFALGGVCLENLRHVLNAGCRRVAVSHAICAAEDPRKMCSQMRRALEEQGTL